jgi:pimeloyl-ACP methyl ester carboxylesterase
MNKFKLTYCFVLFSAAIAFAQMPNRAIDTSINNLVHVAGYNTSEWGAIPQYIKTGSGKKNLILIPGLGLDAAIFNDFMAANKKKYTMYAITIPGYGETNAPPMPKLGTSYGEQSWNKGVVAGIAKLIKKEKISNPVIVGHFTQGVQLALRMAIDFPDLPHSIILLGGQAKFIANFNGLARETRLDTMILYTDRYTAPKWFKNMPQKDFDAGNYPTNLYSLDSLNGQACWHQVAKVPLPVMVQYLCEFFASDIKTEMHKIKCRVLVLRPTFNETVLDLPQNSFIRFQFIDTWNNSSAINPLIQVKDIEGAACLVWKDKPLETYRLIHKFLKGR